MPARLRHYVVFDGAEKAKEMQQRQDSSPLVYVSKGDWGGAMALKGWERFFMESSALMKVSYAPITIAQGLLRVQNMS